VYREPAGRKYEESKIYQQGAEQNGIGLCQPSQQPVIRVTGKQNLESLF